MAFFARFNPIVAAFAAIALPVMAQGCSSSDNPLNTVTNAAGAICCTQFKPGTDMLNVSFTADAATNGEFVGFAQATGDMSLVAGQALSDVTQACRNIAVDLGADPTSDGSGVDGGTPKTGTDAASFWCSSAATQLTSAVGGSVTAALTISFAAPKCDIDVQATASCQGHCNVSGGCDLKANPPTCTGGTLDIDCKGGCTGSASAPTIDCTGSCSGTCTGSCNATGGVDCAGSCQGTCSAGTNAGETGIQADGSCKGTCKGTCSVVAPSVTCMGTCTGSCNAKCSASPGQASVSCSGTCDADYTPLSCKGGTLSGGCMVDANCQANCNASASAKASCTPPELTIVATASATTNIDAVIATLKTNLPTLLVVVQARGKGFVDDFSAVASGGATIATSGKLDVGGLACGVLISAQAVSAAADFSGAFSAAGSFTAMVVGS